MGQGDIVRVRSQRPRGDRVCVALDHHSRWMHRPEQLVELREGDADLRSSRAPAHTDVHVRLAHAELGEEGRGEILIEVLTGVDHQGAITEKLDDLGEFDDLGASAEHDGDRSARS